MRLPVWTVKKMELFSPCLSVICRDLSDNTMIKPCAFCRIGADASVRTHNQKISVLKHDVICIRKVVRILLAKAVCNELLSPERALVLPFLKILADRIVSTMTITVS